MKPPHADVEALNSAKYAVYALLGAAAVLKTLSWGFGLLGEVGRGQLSSSAAARSTSHSLANLSSGLAMSAAALTLLTLAYWVSSAVGPAGYSLDDVRRGSGIVRFAIEVGVIIGAGVLALAMSDGLVGFIALGVSLAYGVFRTLDFFGRARLGRVAARISRGLLGKAAGADAIRQSNSYAQYMREYRAGQQAGTPKRAERALRTAARPGQGSCGFGPRRPTSLSGSSKSQRSGPRNRRSCGRRVRGRPG